MRPGRRRLAGDRGGYEVALRIALATHVEVVLSGPQKTAAIKVPLDPPDVEAATRRAKMLRPNVVSFLDTMLRHSEGYRFEEATIAEGSAAAGRNLRELDLFGRFAINPLAIREDGAFHYNPSPDHKLKVGDTLLVIAEPDKLARLRQYLSA